MDAGVSAAIELLKGLITRIANAGMSLRSLHDTLLELEKELNIIATLSKNKFKGKESCEQYCIDTIEEAKQLLERLSDSWRQTRSKDGSFKSKFESFFKKSKKVSVQVMDPLWVTYEDRVSVVTEKFKKIIDMLQTTALTNLDAKQADVNKLDSYAQDLKELWCDKYGSSTMNESAFDDFSRHLLEKYPELKEDDAEEWITLLWSDLRGRYVNEKGLVSISSVQREITEMKSHSLKEAFSKSLKEVKGMMFFSSRLLVVH